MDRMKSLRSFVQTASRAFSLLAIVTAVLLPVGGWADAFSKSNSLAIDKDAGTNNWIAACDIAVGGVDNRQTYSGRMLFEFAPSGQGSTFVFDALFQVDPQNRAWTESNPGIYKVTAKLKGHDVVVHAEVIFSAINAGDSRADASRCEYRTTAFIDSN